jgi:hypothetical protein
LIFSIFLCFFSPTRLKTPHNKAGKYHAAAG